MRPCMECRNRRIRKSALVTALALLLTPTLALAQGTGIISGKVTEKDGKTGIPYAQISLLGTTGGVVADEQGQFTMSAVPAGTRSIRVLQLGYAPLVHQVIVHAGETVTL